MSIGNRFIELATGVSMIAFAGWLYSITGSPHLAPLFVILMLLGGVIVVGSSFFTARDRPRVDLFDSVLWKR